MTKNEIAHHEAGHAVIARKLGLRCGEATVLPDYNEMTAGYAILRDPWEAIALWEKQGKFREHDSALRARVLALMAGAEAEIVILGQASGGDGDDRREIALTLEYLGRTSASDEERFRRQTRRLINRHRDLIETVAFQLSLYETISAEELDRIVPTYMPRRQLPFWATDAEHKFQEERK